MGLENQDLFAEGKAVLDDSDDDLIGEGFVGGAELSAGLQDPVDEGVDPLVSSKMIEARAFHALMPSPSGTALTIANASAWTAVISLDEFDELLLGKKGSETEAPFVPVFVLSGEVDSLDSIGTNQDAEFRKD